MTIIWGGTLAVLLSRFRRHFNKLERIRFDEKDQFKRIGVYYMCIDDLPL